MPHEYAVFLGLFQKAGLRPPALDKFRKYEPLKE